MSPRYRKRQDPLARPLHNLLARNLKRLMDEAREGQVVRLAGQGRRQPGMKPGDALVTLSLIAHPRFQVSGHDLRTDAVLPLFTAIKGGRIPVETLDGKIALTVPAWTNSGKVFRLKGKGLPKKGGGHGDLLVTVGIALPDNDRDELEQLAGKWLEKAANRG